MKRLALAVSFLALTAGSAWAQATETVERAAVEAHMDFLAGDELQGRGSATRDEAIAAAYVTAQFRLAGLTPVPGMDGYIQRAPLVLTTPSGRATLTVGDVTLNQGPDLAVMAGATQEAAGALVSGATTGEVVMLAPPEGPAMGAVVGPAVQAGARLIILRRTDHLARMASYAGRRSARLAEATPRAGPIIVVVSPEAYDRLQGVSGAAAFAPGEALVEERITSNAMGWIQGTDPDAGVLMISSHLDHLGVVNGVVMHGANDDASGTVAVIELARALASGAPHRRSIMFVSYGSEELGLLGSRYFVNHPPIPLDSIAVNLEIEMIGKQDPNLSNGRLMMTGFERSTFGAELSARGGLVGPDPYPEENFFTRSDNYPLAQRGIVAHTVSGWATTPTYHQATDTIADLDMDYMVSTIRSLVEPLRAVADGDVTPTWVEGGRPTAED